VKPRILTAEIDAKLEEIAAHKAAIPRFRDLERETGITAGYLRQLVSAKLKKMARTNKALVSCETKND
jgi:hypothetical protein